MIYFYELIQGQTFKKKKKSNTLSAECSSAAIEAQTIKIFYLLGMYVRGEADVCFKQQCVYVLFMQAYHITLPLNVIIPDYRPGDYTWPRVDK